MIPEETLDPADWGQLRQLGHRMVDDMLDYLEGVRERPVWQSVPAEVRSALETPLPLEPSEPAAVYDEFRRNILPYPPATSTPASGAG